MANQRNIDKSLKYYSLLSDSLLKSIEISDVLLSHLKDTDHRALDAFKSFIAPHKKITALLHFYDQYTNVSKGFDSIAIELEKHGINIGIVNYGEPIIDNKSDNKKGMLDNVMAGMDKLNLNSMPDNKTLSTDIKNNKYSNSIKNTTDETIENNTITLEMLKDIKILEKINNLNDYKKCLSEFMEVKIVSDFCKRIDLFVEKITDIIKVAFFNNLRSLPKINNLVPEFSGHIIKFYKDYPEEKKTFLANYVKEAHKRLGFVSINGNFNVLIQETENLTKYFSMIININNKILGSSDANSVNIGLISLIIVNLRIVISDILGAIDKNNDPSEIVHLIKLSSNLKHSKGPIIKEIESLFVFKKTILTLIQNCLIQFFTDLELLDSANSEFQAEDLCKTMACILDAFKKEKSVRNAWLEVYGPSLGVHKDLSKNFAVKCLNKVHVLVDDIQGKYNRIYGKTVLSDIFKYIYLINNYYCFRDHLFIYKDKELKTSIDKYTEIIIGLWRINIENMGTNKLISRITADVIKHNEYMLPPQQQIYISEKLKEIIENLIATTGLHGNLKDLNSALNNIYKGK